MHGHAWVWLLIGVGLAAWIRSDWRYFNRWTIHRDQLEREGRWDELRAYLDAHYRTRRPFVRLLRLWMPGLADATHSLALHKLGDEIQALACNDLALRRARTKKTRLAALTVRAAILQSLCRYDDVRKLVPEITSLGLPSAAAMGVVAMAEFHSGRVDEAISMARAIIAADPPTDQARNLLVRALRMKGAFAEALALLDFEPSDGTKVFRDLDLTRSKEVRAFVERDQARQATMWKAFKSMAIAQLHIDVGDPARALEALDGCAPLVTINLMLEVRYRQVLARVWALRGDGPKVDEQLARVQEIVAAHPKYGSGIGVSSSAGLCALELGQFDKALSSLREAMDRAKHPIERHAINFRIAQTHARAGRKTEAAQSYQKVVTDGFSTAYHTRALEALAELA